MYCGARKLQRGAVAIMVALLIIPMIALLGIVVDLGHLYVRKTELQNAADAAALAGAIRLNGQASGIGAATTNAIAIAAANASDLGQTTVGIGEAQIRFGPGPDGPWSDKAAAEGNAANMRFIKVDTAGIAQGTRPTWFMAVVNSALASTTATGLAVAGAPVCDGLPIFICPPPGGFVPGQAYFFADNPGAPIGPGNIGYFDPVPTGAPSLIPPGASEMSDIVCVGKTYCIGAGTYSSRTQAAFGKMEKAFNTRFGVYQGELADKAEVCRPDTNVKEYTPTQVAWMASPPSDQLGVSWSALRPATLPGTPPVDGDYPSATSGGGTPYTQTTSTFYSPPTGHESYAQAGRRIITMAIGGAAACDGSVNGSGKAVPITGYGRFFMPVKAKGTGNPKGIYVEFIEPIAQLQASLPELKLYR